MKEYLKKMLSGKCDEVSLMRHMAFVTFVAAIIIAFINCFIEKDVTTMVIGMLTAAGISKGVQKFAERKINR